MKGRDVKLSQNQWNELITAAKSAMQKAYVPYSHFQVGAAILTKEKKIITGCNIENASYGLTNCAERTALFKAYSEGETQFEAMVVIADSVGPVSPCGACRQVILELYPEGAPIMLTNLRGDQLMTTSDDLLPHGFKTIPEPTL